MKQLDDLLAEIGRERRAQMTPPPLRAPAVPVRRFPLLAWVPALAAVVAVVFMLVPRQAPVAPQAVAAPAPAQRALAKVDAPPVVPAPAGARVVEMRKPRLPFGRRAVEWRTEFVSVPGAEALPEPQAAGVLRVEVSAEALQGYGIVASGGEAPALVRADLLIGDDGLARAIRLVQ